MKKTGKGMNITLWVVTVLLAGVFLVAGLLKIGGVLDPEFTRWGYTLDTARMIGLLEIAGAIGLLFKRAAGWSAAGLIVITLGWMWTHLVHGEYILLIAPIVAFVLLAFVAWGRGLPWRTRVSGEVAPGSPDLPGRV